MGESQISSYLFELSNEKYVPPLLFKYRSWNNPYQKSILTKKEIYFPSAFDFNDPFDCGIPLTACGNHSDIRYYYYKDICERNPNLPKRIAEHEAKRVMKMELYKDTQYHEQWHRDCVKNKYGIFSLSEDYSNLLMWSHYADSHKGICVGINYKQVIESAFVHGCPKKPNEPCILYLMKVKYYDNWPTLNYKLIHESKDKRNRVDKFIEVAQPLVSKSRQWEYEKEWRILSFEVNSFSLKIPSSAISSIFLGLRISPEHKQEILNLVRSDFPQVEVHEAKKSNKQFGLEFNKIQI